MMTIERTAAPEVATDTSLSNDLQEPSKGFLLPSTLPAMPVLEGAKSLLSLPQEQALGYRIILGQFGVLKAISHDTSILQGLVSEIWNAIGENESVDKAAAMIFQDGAWVRAGAIPDADFASLLRKKLNTIQTLISELKAFAEPGFEDNLFVAAVRADLQKKVLEILPYDLVLNRAAGEFRAKCKDISGLCKDLVKYISDEVRIPRRSVGRIINGKWTSPKLMPSLMLSGGYELRLYPQKELRRLRQAIVDQQRLIYSAASTADIPAEDLLAALEEFNAAERVVHDSVGFFASANIRLVDQVVSGYRFANDLEQVRSAAQLGLVRSIYRYAPEKGFKFSTLGMTWIRQTILRDLTQQELIRLPEGSHGALSKLNAALKEHPNASKPHLSKMTGLSLDDVENLLFFVGSGKPVSLDSTFQESGSSEAEGMHEHLADQNNCFADEVIEENTAAYVSDVLGEVLTERELQVVIARFGIGGGEPQTLATLSEKMGVSKERVRQIENEALKKLKDSRFAGTLLELLA
ncbi:sigma-70 family RNA polymerase sigma factor [Pseudomonas sp.]|uniref:sigma-70 family RNA polymerase sigma factor n=1 Tax=Pseudomonas sp. TaxID=306 RepID=UPI0029111F24|nr:sigma-70 family RNA polymerase sigma factor [Pseudomonas sp.]MDU4254159.1 sigma-70 family RNA polymerase sigma factor [Pseudomonas sp.]